MKGVAIMSEYLSCIKSMLLATLPALFLGAVIYLFICLTQGAEGLGTVSGLWYFIFFVAFLFILAVKNNGKQIFARSLRYFAYELWVLPLFVFIYFVVTGGQVSPQDKAMGQTMGMLAAILVSGGVAIVSALVGLVCYMISNNMLKK